MSALEGGEQMTPKSLSTTCNRIRQTANRITNIVKSMRALAREGAQDEMRSYEGGADRG